MKKEQKSGLMPIVWHLLETFKPDGLEQHDFPDRGEIHFLKNGVFLTFWLDKGVEDPEPQATIVYNGKNEYIKGKYDSILKKLEEKLEEAK